MSVIEVVIAFAIFLAVLLPVANLLDTGVQSAGESVSRVVAANLATQQMERLAAEPYADIAPNATRSWAQVVGGARYDLTESTRFIPESPSANACDAPGQGGANLQPELLVQVTVTWAGLGNLAAVRQSSTFTPPAGTYSNTGNLDVQVLGASGTDPQPAIPVTFVGPAPSTASVVIPTDPNGCAFAAYLRPGSYEVSLSTAGYVDAQGNPAPSLSESVQVGVTTDVQVSFAKAATISVRVAPAATPTGAVAAAGGLPMSVGNVALQPSGTLAFPPGATSLGGLFPYPSGYGVWAGECPDSNPSAASASGSALYPGTAPAGVVPVTPGGVAAASVPTYALELAVTTGAGSGGGTATLSATPAAGHAASSCSGAHAFALADPTGAAGLSATGVPLGELDVTVTPSDGAPVTIQVWVKPAGVELESGGSPVAWYPTGTPIPVQA